MRLQIYLGILVGTLVLSQAKAQDAYAVNDSNLESKPLVIAGTKKGKCTPEMPMMSPGVYSIELQATADKTFVLDSKDLGLHMEAARGQTQATLLTFAKGNFDFICGDKSLTENNRTKGMFMVMDM